MSFTVIAFDPGKTTGWCIFEVNDHQAKLIKAGQTKELTKLLLAMPMQNCIWIFEGFARGNSSSGDQVLTMQYCGAIETFAEQHNIDCILQYPASRKGFVRPAKAMVKEIFQGGDKEYHHAFDAIAHALAYFEKEDIEWNKQHWLRMVLQTSKF